MSESPKRAAPEAEPDRAAPRPCPICGKPSVAAHRPFCSQRCADVDLNRWLGGVYVVPVTEADEDEAERPSEDGRSE